MMDQSMDQTDEIIAQTPVMLLFTGGDLCMFTNRLEFRAKNSKKSKIIL